MTIDIIGAGIGGLTTAIALERKGFKTRLFEQAETIRPVGAGIIIANNAMQVFDRLGLRQMIEAGGNAISSMNITRTDLQPISSVDLSFFERKYQVKNIAIHRGVLQQTLMDQLKSTEIFLGHRLENIRKLKDECLLEFENGKTYRSSILIGADGLNSTVRQHVLPDHQLRKAKQICWRGVVDFELPLKYQGQLNEAWGNADRFGLVPLAKNKVYWYALKSYTKDKTELSLSHLTNYFDQYSSLVQAIISSTNKEDVHTAEISDLKPTFNWFKNNICLIGDAAHAATPNMGQGACQAIEDAYVLSECLNSYEREKAFEVFQKLRMPKVHKVVQSSWLIGKIAHLSNPLLVHLRNAIIRYTPASVNRRQVARIFQLERLGE